ncbi:Inherit from KOG: Notch ligand involved in the mediation of Notch signaling (By similarity) [Seminavis robusta]|uniref:Inherit from KOG: Notch ligand involved in the mediation of Notch signaling By similarity n=1 Tax=Seminavis robusta TaxID=568900 RepID=A0A9N8DNS0_9STRA|nr:Inherit from KOG: Notch ligand involved in the mediation of Notch signaling (By similarity) [Seminavis robusta]|eukprot:Sro264_g102680.1 Inherit from KOG: Notch ligand involved in the mediation of Notch signaling (By similarity) (986) ;mRNA; r:78205-81580
MNQAQNHASMEIMEEIDVDSVVLEPPRAEMSNSSLLSGGGEGVESLLASMSTKDVKALARLLKPAMDEVEEEEDSGMIPSRRDQMAESRRSRHSDEECALIAEGGNEDDAAKDEVAEKKTTTTSSWNVFASTRIMKWVTAEEEAAETHAPFGASAYTLLYMCDFNSQAFWYAMFTYIIQISTITLTLIDVVDWSGEGNGFNLPPMVSISVTLAQFVTLFQALAFQSDLLEAALKLQDGFYPEVQEKYPGATYSTWLLSCLSQLLAGFLLLITIFILTMQVDSVLAIMLNFAALHFMADIDDLGFYIAQMGFISVKLSKATNAVADFEVPKREHKRAFFRRVLYGLTMLLLMCGYGVLKYRQLSGEFLQTAVYVQFGDEYNPKIPFYSGVLSAGNVRTTGHRKYWDIQTGTILLSYCSSEGAWTFSDTGESCDYFAKSLPTKTYDVTTIPDSSWEVLDSIDRLKPFEAFTLIGRDCDPNICQGGCVEGLCKCSPHQFGLDCEFDSVCPKLVINTNHPQFPPMAGRAISDEFEILQNPTTGNFVKVYSMPVYYSNKTYPSNFIFYGGRRWVISSENTLHIHNHTIDVDVEKAENENEWYFYEETIALFESGRFHGFHQATFIPLLLSDPVDFNTPDFRPTPAGLGWSTVATRDEAARLYEPAIEVAASLLCVSCLAEHGGFCHSHGGKCNIDSGLCECNELLGYSGPACEKAPACYDQALPCYGHGECDRVSGLCRCNPPYYGTLCDTSYYCHEANGKCYNDGECNLDTGYCVCPDDPAIAGWACEASKDPHVFGCSNGGTLNSSSTRCDCPEPFYGVLCDLVDVTQEEFVCSNNDDCFVGTCDNTTGICDCGNATTFGTLCEIDFNCTSHGCVNSGVCEPASGLCECDHPFEGHDCGRIPDCLSDEDCIEGGTCHTETGICQCSVIFSLDFGTRCERAGYCDDSKCRNGGVCNVQGFCICPPLYSGPNCEFKLYGVDENENECVDC